MTPRQLRFVEEYLIDLNATQAAIRAGYSEKWAHTNATKLLQNTTIASSVQSAMSKRSERTEITEDFVIGKLIENLNRALQTIPVLDREGKETGEYTYQGSVANKALELLGKHIGLFPEKHEHSGRIEHEHGFTELEAWATGLLDAARARHAAGGLPNGQAAALASPARPANGSIS